MRLLFFVVLASITMVDPATVRKINAAKAAAEEAFKSGNYQAAAGHYRYLVDSLGVREDEVILNLANAQYLSKDTANAFGNYQMATMSDKSHIRSKAYQQLGLMANQQGRPEEALNLFKQAIKAEPTNNDARYNYEMLKKKLEEQKQQQQKEQQENQQNKDQQQEQQQNKDQQQQEQQDEQQKQDQENKDEQNQDQQQKDQQEKSQDEKDKEQQDQEEQQQKDQQQEDQQEEMPNLDREKLEQMKISEEKARMILEAMKNQEKQYLQQQKRKPTQSRDRNKPDW